jgi:hypothetical protein
MPLPLIALAISLASKFAPSLIGKLTKSDKAEQVAEKVIGFAKAVTGQDNPEDAVKTIEANPELALQFQRDLHDYELELAKLEYADAAGGREVIKTALLSDDPIVRRARPMMMILLGKTCVVYAFYAPLAVVAAQSVGIDTIAFMTMIKWIGGFLFGSFSTSFTGYTVARSVDKNIATKGEAGIGSAFKMISKLGNFVAGSK